MPIPDVHSQVSCWAVYLIRTSRSVLSPLSPFPPLKPYSTRSCSVLRVINGILHGLTWARRDFLHGMASFYLSLVCRDTRRMSVDCERLRLQNKKTTHMCIKVDKGEVRRQRERSKTQPHTTSRITSCSYSGIEDNHPGCLGRVIWPDQERCFRSQ